MKVSIKNLHITFMGNDETKTNEAPKEFYSPYERELRAKLETLRGDFNEMQRQRDDMTKSRDLLVMAHKACVEELTLIAGWVRGYDNGEWPDHNASGVSDVSREVLHMLRDFQADIESRPLPGLQPGAWKRAQPSDLANPVGVGQVAPEMPVSQPAAPESAMPGPATAPQMATAKICPGFNCSNFLGIGQTYCMAEDCAASHNARFPQQPTLPSNNPETDGILFEGIQRRDPGALVNFIEGKLTKCPAPECNKPIGLHQRYCGSAECERSQEVIASVNQQREPQNVTADADQYEPTLSCKDRPPCMVEGCDEPRDKSSFCTHHRKVTNR